MESNKIKKPVKIGAVVAVIALLAAGVSVYATGSMPGSGISESEARQIALAEVKGADESDITKFKKDMDDGREEYDIEIIHGGYEYDFEISVKDGTIFDRSKEKLDADDIADIAEGNKNNGSVVVTEHHNQPAPSASSSSAPSSGISLDRAKSIALAQVSGASSSHITKAESDYDDGRLEYEIEIRYNGYEYDFEIDGSTGNIVGKDVDSIDYDD